MAAFKNKDNGTWYVQFRYPDILSVKFVQTIKKGN